MTAEEAILGKIDASIRQLEIDYRRYFAGDLPFAPEDLENSIRAELRRLRNHQLKRASDTFRLGALEARFNSYAEMFRRRFREREEGRAIGRPVVAGGGDVAPAPRPAYHRDDGVVVGERVEREVVGALWEDLARAGGAGSMSADALAQYLERQAEAIRAKTGRSKVQFRIVEEEGRVKLKARPLA